MKQEISLEDAKQQILLGACQIYSAYVQKFNVEHDQDEKYLTKAAAEAIKLARLIDHATCLEGEICDAGKMWEQYGVSGT